MTSGQSGAATGAAVAIVGMSGRMPGAPDLDTFWKNLREGRESITFFTNEELLARGEKPEALVDPAYVKACGKLADADKFDAQFFGMSPRDAAVFDPQHRLFLECAWEAFEDAGHVGERFDGRVAVYAGCGGTEYMMYNLLRNRQVVETVGPWLIRHTGNDPNFLATRVSYELDLTGPSMNVQTACSSSLVAVHLACQSLLGGECDMALAGGSTVYPEQDKGYLYKEGEILSPDGHCRPFDARSAGTVMASAVGCVLLRRLEDAVRDGDRILAVIRGSAINNDGSSKVGYLAPSVSGQARVVAEALAISGVHPDDVTYIEAHGTGTLIGDPIEVTALTQAFREETDRKQYCAIGSLKSNIGHTGEAAGICGLIKAVLALQHRELPPSIHYDSPNPQIDFAESPFYVCSQLRPWHMAPGAPRIAGVTALGAGGTNAHVLIEEALDPAPRTGAHVGSRPELLVLSAKTKSAVDRMCERLAEHLRAHPDIDLADVASTLLVGRKAFAHRRAVVASTPTSAADALVDPGAKGAIAQKADGESPSVAFMFPGGGAQYARMGQELYDDEPVYRETFDECLSHLEPALRSEVRALCFPPPESARQASARLESPSVGLPALFATELAIARLLMSWGLTPSALIGHSAGEYAAACLSGVLSVRDALSLVALRGQLFETLPEGGMLSVALPAAEAQRRMGPELSFAAINGPALCVASGPVGAVARLESALKTEDVECTRIHIRVAAHSAMLDPILSRFESFSRTIHYETPKIPFVSNLTGTWITDEEATDPTYWVKHLRGTVQFAAGMNVMLESAARAYVEIGPGRTLSSLARQQSQKPAVAAPTLRHPQEQGADRAFLLGAIGRVWAAGVAIDAPRFSGPGRRRVALPTYPFERQRYWVNPDAQARGDSESGDLVLTKRADVGAWFHAPSWAQSAAPASSAEGEEKNTWLVLTDGSDLATAIELQLRSRGARVVRVMPGERLTKLDEATYLLSTGRGLEYEALVGELRERGLTPNRVLHLWALASRPSGEKLGPLWPWDALGQHPEGLRRHYFSLVLLMRALAASGDDLRVFAVSSHMQAVYDEGSIHPEKAVLLGACKVVPREFPNIACTSIDVVLPSTRAEQRELARRVVRELESDSGAAAGEIALRGEHRWVRRWDPVRLPRPRDPLPLREGGVYIITGGLGGIGLALAEHLARKVRARLLLISRTPLIEPAKGARASDPALARRIARIHGMRDLGAEVSVVAADVTDLRAMREVVSGGRIRFGAIHGIFHAAGILHDELIALRTSVTESPVIDAKVKGALVLDALFAREHLDLFVLFSSVSSILGLAGQADYSAANAFLDAFAHARSRARPRQQTLSINWNAWQEVGMLADRVQGPRGNHPMLAEVASQTSAATLFRTVCRRRDTWLLSEHVVRGGESLIPGTGWLEIARAAASYDAPDDGLAVELSNVFFLAPFVVGPEEQRELHVRIDRHGDGTFVAYGSSEEDVFVTGRVNRVRPPAAERVDLAAVQLRCKPTDDARGGFLVQRFMNFGPRWGNVKSIHRGEREALLRLELPAAYAADLDIFRLHPALFDIATGGAQALIPGFEASPAFFAPFSYGRVLLFRALPRVVASHVRLREIGAEGSAVFDATICDEHGDVVATVEQFVMRRVGASLGRRPAVAPEPLVSDGAPRRAHAESPNEAALRVGMTPEEGLDALERMLSVRFSPQLVASTVDIEVWLRVLAQPESARTGGWSRVDDGPVFDRPDLSSTFVAPRDDIENALAAMWRELLGAAEVGVHDDFFELGGQSLVAVRLFHRVSKKFGVELPMTSLLEAPTIAATAALVRDRLGLSDASAEHSLNGGAAANGNGAASENGAASFAVAGAPAFRSLVAVQPGSPGLQPFYCVHGAGGNVLNFRDLSRAMPREQPFYGLQARGIDGVLLPHHSVEGMASDYLTEIRALQPHGPYLIGGYSGGGVVAFEIAQQLTRSGEHVALLAFIDTPHPQMQTTKLTLLTRIKGAGLKQRFSSLAAEGVPFIVRGMRRHRDDAEQLARIERDMRQIAELRSRGEPIPFSLRDLYLSKNYEAVASRYRPLPWNGQAVLFRATDVHFLFREGGPYYGWQATILGGIEVVLVPGNHDTLLLGKSAEIMARSLSDAIDRVQREVRRSSKPISDPPLAPSGQTFERPTSAA